MTYLDQIIELDCPVIILDEETAFPVLDPKTVRKENGRNIGCRGITCKQCWNQEEENTL